MGLTVGPKAYLISVGNELLIGKVVNTNLAWLGRKLTDLGYRVEGGLIVPDEPDLIAWAFSTAVVRGARVVVSTGGLGPTFDDMTVEGLAKAMGVELELNDDALKVIKEKYRGDLTESRVKMAKLPKGAKPIYNPVGTAPGVEVEWKGAHLFLLPGVPAEMEAIFESYVEPKLRKLEPLKCRSEALLKVSGVPESLAAPVIKEALKLSEKVYVKSHPKGSELGVPVLELHVTAFDDERERAATLVTTVVQFLERKLNNLGARVQRIG
ncbi:MAG: nicotinamide mononucleotide deamidase-related protein [Thermofilaceae archaeon]|nr:nicotinamide mononucleotide deamidase-related protein [Thermofilaceae archaeon]MDW8003475.1 nicotinamide mononucleotide deamidase-related protein [Thermofilaceae archaeon]